ncbi:MAG: peptidylprolyl isomerase [Planctomycetota bacterium]
MSYLHAVCLVVSLFTTGLVNQTEAEKTTRKRTAGTPSPQHDKSAAVLLVGATPITLADIDFHLGRPAGEYRRQPLPLAVRNRAVDLMVQQRRALETLRRSKLAATREEALLWIREQNRGQEPEQSVSALIREQAERAGVSERMVVERVSFRLSWKKYLAKHLNESNLEKYFSAKPARFEGTKFDLDVVSLPVSLGVPAEREEAKRRLEAFREETLTKDAEGFAAEANEQGLRSERLKEVRLLGDIEPAIVDAVIDLQAGSVSEVIDTVDRVHLVRVHRRQPGERTVGEVRSEVRLHMILFLLERLAAQSRDQLPLTVPDSE